MLKKSISASFASLLSCLLLAVTARAAQAPTVADVATVTADLSTFVSALKAARLLDALKGAGPFTVFAPSNAAFAKLGKKKGAYLLADKDLLKKVLLYHLVSGKLPAADLKKLPDGENVKTINGATCTVRNKDGLTVNGVKVIRSDMLAGNGVVHLLDAVLLPPAVKAPPETRPQATR